MKDIRTTLFELIKAQFAVDYLDGTESLVNTLGADSLDKVELSVEIDYEFNLELGYDKIDKVSTVEDLYSLIQKHLDEAGRSAQ